MDFAWAVCALRRGLKVTRKNWLLAIPPMYLYMMTEKPDGKHIIKMHPGTGPDFEWTPTAEQMLIVDDWEEYVDPKEGIQLRSITGETIKITHEEMPVWPEVNADGYARMSKDSDVIVHDGVYRSKKELMKAEEDQSDYAKEARKIVDGLPVRGLPCEHEAVVKGDARCFLVAAASIVAKVSRDRILRRLDAEHPGYGLAEHKGYPTPAHLEALARLGVSPVHRRSFGPVRDVLNPPML